jgi:hypothetical protein
MCLATRMRYVVSIWLHGKRDGYPRCVWTQLDDDSNIIFFQLRTSPPGVYTSALSVLSEEIILLIRLYEPALELCRLSNIDDREKASLETVRILSLPVFARKTFSLWTACFDKHPGHALFSKNRRQNPSDLLSTSSGPSTRQPEDRVGARRRLHSVPMDSMIIVEMFVLGHLRVIDLAVRRRTLLGFIDAQPQTGSTYAAETGIRVGTELTVPWENWGPANSRIRVLGTGSHIYGSLTGERRVTVLVPERTCIVMRDYNPFRVQRALALSGGTGRDVLLECGSHVRVVKEPSVHPAWFRDELETSLPYVETVTPCTDDTCEGVFMDEDSLLVQVRTKVSHVYVHLCLGTKMSD